MLRETLAAYNWNAVLAEGIEVDAAYDNFVSILKGLIKICIPFKTVTIRDRDPWFVTPLVKSLLRKRNCLYHRGRVDRAELLSIKIGKIINAIRAERFSKIDPRDTNKLWQMISKNTNYSNRCKIESLGIKTDEEIEKINEFFTNVATDPDYDIKNIRNIVESNMGAPSVQSLITISEFEVFMSLSQLKKTAPGPDDIPYWGFKECAYELSGIITYIFNSSLKSGVVPEAWKKAYITPVPKVRNASEYRDFADLRPISVTPILSRLVEKIVVQRYLWPLMDDEQMNDQFAFRSTGSTTAALITLMHTIYSMFDQGNDYVRCVLIDYSKAFDVVNHEILLNELGTLGLHDSIFKWIANFLTGRTQAVKIGAFISAFLLITRSIVQGSGLGPYLYILLARRLKLLSVMNAIVKYADDTTLVVPQYTDCSVEAELQHIANWSCDNKQTINPSKTKEIIFLEIW